MPEQDLEFEWDEAKAKLNLRKHGVSFFTATAIFRSRRVERIDDREDYGEVRWIALGRAGSQVYRVTYTLRGENVIRFISAQKANKIDQKTYYRAIYP